MVMSISKIYQKVIFRVLKLLSLSISAILGIFCTFGGCMNGPAPMYGMPNADYKVSGTVSSADQDMPIKGLFVSIADTLESPRIFDSTKTDSLGRYSLQSSGVLENTWVLQVKDIDLIENGSFAAKDTIISIPESELKEPSGEWYRGHVEKNVDLKVDRID
jgi:putative lipoprotein (rSAM/lipoprotein system)